jgi:hypothetical protein
MSRIIINCVITVDQGRVDEVLFWVDPTIQGPGERPFPGGGPIDWNCLGHEASTPVSRCCTIGPAE